MRFLTLLDRRKVVFDGPGLSIGEQAAAARAKFPGLVQDSAFSYWRPGDSIAKIPLRLLLGVSPTFDLTNLRLLDLLQDKIEIDCPEGLQIDVFDLDDMKDWASASSYFPGINSMVPNPIAGVWTLGYHIANFWGGSATEYLLSAFDLGITASELAQSVRPPSDDMFD